MLPLTWLFKLKIKNHSINIPCIDAFEDQESIPLVYQMIQEEGLCLGGSTGVNVAGAIRLAKELGPGNTIVTILCDSGLIYKARLFNKNFLAKHKIQLPEWLDIENLS